ncbi:MAG: RagB/SusD family nutrient uptake outer membrane protein [Segetibacter sp.]|nr:RagB/SusD family nutrient uptake outer membrane protein [Segetibacter sp.]
MKKKIMISVGAIATVLILFSCKKNFIELAPISTVSTDALYKTDKDFKDAVIGIYGVYQNQYQNMWLFGDMRGDDSWDELVKGTAAAMDNFTINNDDGVINSTWLNYYNIINRANTLLAKIENADVAVVPNLNVYIGEARFLRALAYFDLVRIYGDVPMVTSLLTIEEGYKQGREKVAKIYDEVIIKDLLFSEANLPAKFTGLDVGRATKGAAKSLLGKVYLTTKDFVKAEAKLQEVTTMGYSLLPKYTDLFDYTKDEHHSEYIFDIEYEQGIGEGNCFTTNFSPKDPATAAFYGVTGGQNGNNNPPRSLFALFPSGDLRKDITAADGFTDASGVFRPLIPTSNDVQTYTKKYMVKLLASCDSRANWKVIRYADVLLMYAEALNENGKTPEALKWLNMVRVRAGLQSYSDLTQDAARDNIYLERRLELSFEGHRWFDLVRTGRALSVMSKFGMKPHMTVFPLPISQVKLINNPSIFAQNQGYD